jgi:hypothetical protein
MRRIGQATFGGDTHVSTQDAFDRYSEAIILRKEGVLLAVKGPVGRRNPGLTPRQAKRHERRRQFVHQRLVRLCDQLKVPYFGTEKPWWKTRPTGRATRVGDGLHANEAGHVVLADDYYPFIRDSWAAHTASLETRGHLQGRLT